MKFSSIELSFDLIIIGSGGAGLMSALSAKNNGVEKIAVISKTHPIQSHTVAAKGGINAALGNVSEDNWRWHAFDTIKGSDYLADFDSVELMCKNAPKTIANLEKMGVVFSRNEDGKIDQRPYGAQTTNFGKGELSKRACYSKDKTGHAIIHTLYQKSLSQNIKFFSECVVFDLLIYDKKCFGCLAFDLNSGKIIIFKSRATVIACGGFGQIYSNTTTSSQCTGDGSTLAALSQIPLQDMEFIQFHPTGIYNSGILITEAARAEGGILLNSLGDRFMKKYSPTLMELSSRDVIARAIISEIKDGRGIDGRFINLDLTSLDYKTLTGPLSGLFEIAQKYIGIDPSKNPIPVFPSAHYTMGGIPVNSELQVSYKEDENNVTIEGLLACGEASCVSVHGANRLGCNSLLEVIVFGEESGISAAKIIKNYTQSSISDNIITQKISEFNNLFSQNSDRKTSLSALKKDLRESNDVNIGIFRDHTSLSTHLESIKEKIAILSNYRIKDQSTVWNDELVQYFDLRSLLVNSLICTYSAIQRTESRGAHYRNDYKERDDINWRIHSLVFLEKDSMELKFSKKEVRLNSSELSQIPEISDSLKVRMY